MNTDPISYPQQNNLQSVLEAFSDGVLIEKNNRVVEAVNGSFCNLFRLRLATASIIGNNSYDVIVNISIQFKNPSRFIYRIDEIINAGQPIKGEELHLQDGRVLVLDYSPVYNINQLVGHSWVYKLKQKEIVADPAMGDDTLLFKKLFNNIPAAVAVLNTHHEYVYVNQTALPDENKRKIQVGRTEIEFNNYFNKPNDTAINNARLIREAIQSRTKVVYEEKHLAQDGSDVFNKIILYPLISTSGDLTHVIKLSFDITEYKQKENLSNQVVSEYLEIINKISDAVIVADDSLVLGFSNNSFLNKLQVAKDLQGNTLFNHIDIKQYDFYRQVFTIMTGKEDKFLGRITLKDNNNRNKTFKYSVSKRTSKKQGGIVAILNDITGEVALEENLLEVVKREKELNELKSAFVNMVSHEMRTPLAIISSCAEIIQLMLANNKPKEDIEKHAGNILSEVERMTTFMDDILMISKIEAGKIEFKPEEISLVNFVSDISKQSYSPWKDGRTLEITTKGNEKIFPADQKMIRHILQNLLENAFKYSSHKESPKLRLRYSKDYMTFAVVDFGLGIHKEDIPNLFSSFSRGRNVGSINGTGIGLVVVKYFVDQHRGTISIKSKQNQGTIFSVKIPY